MHLLDIAHDSSKAGIMVNLELKIGMLSNLNAVYRTVLFTLRLCRMGES